MLLLAVHKFEGIISPMYIPEKFARSCPRSLMGFAFYRRETEGRGRFCREKLEEHGEGPFGEFSCLMDDVDGCGLGRASGFIFEMRGYRGDLGGFARYILGWGLLIARYMCGIMFERAE